MKNAESQQDIKFDKLRSLSKRETQKLLNYINPKLKGQINALESASVVDTDRNKHKTITIKADYTENLMKEIEKLKIENTGLKSQVAILEKEVQKLNQVLGGVIKSQFTKLDHTRFLNKLNIQNKDKIYKLEKDLNNKTQKTKFLIQTLNTQLGLPITSKLVANEKDSLENMKVSVNNRFSQNNVQFQQPLLTSPNRKLHKDSYSLKESNEYTRHHQMNLTEETREEVILDMNYKNTQYGKDKAYKMVNHKESEKTYDKCYSLINLFYGSTSLLYYSNEMIRDFFNSANLGYLLKVFSDINIFGFEIVDKSEKIYFLGKSLLNDFLSAVKLIYKLKLLIDHQNIFINKLLLQDIVSKSQTAVCEILNCKVAYVFLCNYMNSEISCKINDRRIAFSFENNIVQHILKSGTLLNLKDTSLDIRFHLDEFEEKIPDFKPINMLIIPIKKDDMVIALIFSANKKNDDSLAKYFDSNDELVLTVFSQHLAENLLASMNYSEHLSHDLKMTKLLNSIKSIYSINEISELLNFGVNLLKHLFLTDKAQIFVVKDYENGLFYKFDNYFGEAIITNEGIIGNVIGSKKQIYSTKPWLHLSFNANLDLDSSLPVATIPLLSGDFNNKIIGVIQFEYSAIPTTFTVTRDQNDPDYSGISRLDSEIIEIFCENYSNKISKLIAI